MARPEQSLIAPIHVHLDQGKSSKEAILAPKEALATYIIMEVVRRYILDPKDRCQLDNPFFQTIAERYGVKQYQGYFDYRLTGLNLALQDPAANFDDILHRTGEIIYGAYTSKTPVDRLLATMHAVLTERQPYFESYDYQSGQRIPHPVSEADIYAAHTIIGLSEKFRYSDISTTSLTRNEQPFLPSILQWLYENKDRIPTPDMFTKSKQRAQERRQSPQDLYASYISTDHPWINFSNQPPVIQKGFCGALLEEITKHTQGRHILDRDVPAQLQAIADHLFDYQDEYEPNGDKRNIPPIDTEKIRTRLMTVLQNNLQAPVIEVQHLIDLTYELIEDPSYGLTECEQITYLRQRTPQELLRKYQPTSGPWRNYNTLSAIDQRKYCASLIKEIAQHIKGRHAAIPRLDKQLELIQQYIYSEQHTTKAPLIDTVLLRNHLIQVLEKHEERDTLTVEAVAAFTYAVMSDTSIGLTQCPNVLPAKETLRKLPNVVVSVREPDRVRTDDRTRPKTPKKILEEYQDALTELGDLPRYQRYGVAFGLLKELRLHLAVGDAGIHSEVIKQYDMWIEQLRICASMKERGLITGILNQITRKLRGLDSIRPVEIAEKTEQFLKKHQRETNLSVKSLKDFAEERRNDPEDGLEPYEALKPIKRVWSGSTEKASTGWEWTSKGTVANVIRIMRFLNLPAWTWDRIFDNRFWKLREPAIRRTGKYAIYAAEAEWLMNYIPGLRRLDDGFQASAIQIAENLNQNEWYKFGFPPLRKLFYQGIPWLGERLTLLTPEQTYWWQSTLSNFDTGHIWHTIAHTPGGPQALAAITAGVAFRGIHALATKVSDERIPWTEKDFGYYFSKAVSPYGLANAYFFGLPHILRKIAVKTNVMNKKYDYTSETTLKDWFWSKNNEI